MAPNRCLGLFLICRENVEPSPSPAFISSHLPQVTRQRRKKMLASGFGKRQKFV